MTAVPSMPLGTRKPVTEFAGDDENSSRPSAARRRARRLGQALVAVATRPSSVSSFIMRSDSRSPTTSETAGVNAVSPFSWLFRSRARSR